MTICPYCGSEFYLQEPTKGQPVRTYECDCGELTITLTMEHDDAA